ncbi:substrate-binding domain-containing protein [Actinomadura sp. NPDC048955]|uniref:substrate-binding domain-containing protein n=1 Tax=Actinomadura sp. NPDC048955 TaxID=3158228 RepID=UPI0033FB7560
MYHPTRRRAPFLAVLLALPLSLTLAACGSARSEGSAGTVTSAQVLKESTDAVTRAYGTADYTEPGADGPRPASGKNIWVISAWQQVHALVYQGQEVSAAAASLGWKTQVCDGRNNENGGWGGCVRQATAARADGIVLLAVDCAPVRQALVEARRAGVKIASFSGFDCDDPSQGRSKALFDAPARFSAATPTLADFYTRMGRLRADTVIAKTKGEAKILHVSFEDVAMGEYQAKGFTDRIAACGGCRIVDSVKISPADVPGIRQKFETALLKHPQVDVVTVDIDHFFVAGVQQALVAANRPGLLVVGGECQIDNMNYIRSGKGQEICYGASAGYRAYATVDALDRAFQGSPPATAGVGLQIIDRTRNMPAPGTEYTGPVDYSALYKKAWNRQGGAEAP